MRKIQDIYYTEEKNPMQMLDMYLPDTDNFPVIVYFHAGGLIHGNRTCCQNGISYLVPHGVGLVTVEYRMYPDAKFPDFIEDGAAAVKWTFDNIKKYGGNGKIFVGGSSAGGYISQMLCFDDSYLGAHGILPTDVTGYIHDAGQPTAHFYVLKEFGLDSRRVVVDKTAPLYFVGMAKEYSPMLIIYSDNDMQNRPEQTRLLVSTLNHFGYDMEKVEVIEAHGTHCQYLKEFDEDGNNPFGKMVYPFVMKYSEAE